MADLKHILIADDNQANLLIAKTILERDGYKISCVHNGLQAVNAIKVQMENNSQDDSEAASYDVILMDILMPVMDGLKAVRRIQALSDQINIPPIFAFTAFCSPADESRYRLAGFDAILTKPLKQGDVQRALEAIASGTTYAPAKASHISPPDFSTVNLLDDNVIDELRALAAPDRLIQIHSTFWQDTKTCGQIIQKHLPAALNANMSDLMALRKAVHSIKGLSGSVGLLRAVHIARRLQNAPPSQISELITALFETLILSKKPLRAAFLAPQDIRPQNMPCAIQNFLAIQHSGANARTG